MNLLKFDNLRYAYALYNKLFYDNYNDLTIIKYKILSSKFI